MRTLVLALGAIVLAAPVASSGAWADKIHVALAGVDIPADVPGDVADRAKQVLGDTLAKRPEFILTLDGAPDPDKDPAAYRDYLKKNNLRSYSVTAKIAQYTRTVDADPKIAGGQRLKIHVELSLVGASIPDKLLALGGSGASTIIEQVGKTIRPADEKYALDESLQEAIGLAVDDALAKLQKGKK
jgi:hypothetical protein